MKTSDNIRFEINNAIYELPPKRGVTLSQPSHTKLGVRKQHICYLSTSSLIRPSYTIWATIFEKSILT